jgi:glycosyltransferase involved in cell wall biosynthesis
MAEINNLPLVTAVIPTYRRPELVLRAVNCALGQTYRNMEVVVVVDGPDAEVEAVLASVADERLRVVVNEVNSGQALCRNLGVRHAKGEWIAFLDDDDFWLPEKTEKQMAVGMQIDSPCVLVVCKCIDQAPQGERILPYKFPNGTDKFSEYLFCERGSLMPCTWLATRDLMLKVPFAPFIVRIAIEDQEWLMRAAAWNETKLGTVEEPLAIYNNMDFGERETSKGTWEILNLWGMTNRKLFTPKAFCYFMMTYCITRARQRNVGIRVYLYLISAALMLGSARPRTVLFLVAYLVLPGTKRRRIREWLAARSAFLHRNNVRTPLRKDHL